MKASSTLIRNVFWGFVILGSIFLAIFCFKGKLPVAAITKYVFFWALLLFVLAILVFFLPFYKQGKELDALTEILIQKKDPKTYIQELEKFLAAHPTGMIYHVAQMNMAAAYCDLREHRKASEAISKINPRSLSIANRNVYWAYLALISFYLGDKDRGVHIMDVHGKQLQQDQRLKNLGAIPYLDAVFYHLAKGQRKEAREIYAKARRKWTDARYAGDFDYFKNKFGF